MFIKHVARTMQQFDELLKYPPIVPPLQFKLALLEMYKHRVEKRAEQKALMFDRGLLNYKQVHCVVCRHSIRSHVARLQIQAN